MKRKTKRKKRIHPPLAALIAPPTSSSIPNQLDVDVICPSCKTHWANAQVVFGQEMKKSDYAIREDLKGVVKFQKNGLPICPMCSFKFNSMTIYGLLMAKMARKQMDEKTWGGGMYEERAKKIETEKK